MAMLVHLLKDPQLVFGQTLFKGYNITFDMENDRLGFIKQPIVKGEVSPWAIVGFLSIMLVAAAFTILCIWASLFRKRIPSVPKSGKPKQADPEAARLPAKAKKQNALLDE